MLATTNEKEQHPTNIKTTHLLILEDDPAISDVMHQFFSGSGYSSRIEVITDNIIDLVLESNPDVVILDYLLPGINGGELCSQIKKNPQTKDIPVIIYSAYPKVMLSLGTYGCDAFLPKPFDFDELVRTISQLIEVKSE